MSDPCPSAGTVHHTPSVSDRIPPEAVSLVEAATATSLVLRITGSVAVRLHCDRHWPLLVQLGRRPYHDMDFWARGEDRRDIERFFCERGYVTDPQCKHMQEWGIKRLIFEHPGSSMKVDVFMDELVMAHTIDFKRRLTLDYPCVPLTDLLLSKLQIHEITDNDLMDILLLLLEHEIGPGDNEVDADHVARILARDWGFWYEAMQNIHRLREAIVRYTPISGTIQATIEAHLAELEHRIESEPKDRRWRMRAKVGTRRRWYELVGDVDR